MRANLKQCSSTAAVPVTPRRAGDPAGMTSPSRSQLPSGGRSTATSHVQMSQLLQYKQQVTTWRNSKVCHHFPAAVTTSEHPEFGESVLLHIPSLTASLGNTKKECGNRRSLFGLRGCSNSNGKNLWPVWGGKNSALSYNGPH